MSDISLGNVYIDMETMEEMTEVSLAPFDVKVLKSIKG